MIYRSGNDPKNCTKCTNPVYNHPLPPRKFDNRFALQDGFNFTDDLSFRYPVPSGNTIPLLAEKPQTVFLSLFYAPVGEHSVIGVEGDDITEFDLMGIDQTNKQPIPRLYEWRHAAPLGGHQDFPACALQGF